jgi:Xaa-Pro dipeptidase
MNQREDLDTRLLQLRTSMRERGIDTLAMFYGGQHNMLRPDPLLLLLDYRVLGPSALIMRQAGGMELLLSPAWDLARAREALGADLSIAAIAEVDLPAALADAVRRTTGVSAMTGQDVMPVRTARAFFAALGERPRDAADLLRDCAVTRLPFELARVERAAAIADAGFAHLCRIAKPGMWEYEIAAELEYAMQRLGSEDNFGLMSTGAHNVAVRAVCDRRLEAGDSIVSEITPCYRGYFAQLCRTLVLGEPTALQHRKFAMLLEAEDAGLARAMPGQPTSGIAKAVNEVIGAAGYADYCRPPYMRTRGHGLGLGGVAPSDLNEGSPGVLVSGMTMVVHPNQYIPETGYMMLGDTVTIEADGPRLLTRTPRELFSTRL